MQSFSACVPWQTATTHEQSRDVEAVAGSVSRARLGVGRTAALATEVRVDIATERTGRSPVTVESGADNAGEAAAAAASGWTVRR